MATQISKKDFKDTITLNTPISIHEAVAALAKFHEVSPKDILFAFMNLENSYNAEGAMVTFSAKDSNAFASFEVHDKDGNWISRSMIDKVTGDPRQHPH